MYDVHFLCAMMMLKHNHTEPVYVTSMLDKTKQYNVNADIKCCEKESKFTFFAEDIYTDDIAKFITEYDNFVKTKQSNFFFTSNIVNMAKIFKCYYKKCYNEYFEKDIQIKTNISNDFDLEKIYENFMKTKDMLCKLLCDAYLSCTYKDVITIYHSYLDFYLNSFGCVNSFKIYTESSIIGKEVNDCISFIN